MRYFRFNDKDIEELIFDTMAFSTIFDKNENSLNLQIHNNSYYNIKSAQKGEIFYAKASCKFEQNTLITANEGMQCISFHFTENGESLLYTNNKTPTKISANTGNLSFSQNDTVSSVALKKDLELQSSVLILPIPYFKKFVALYPDMLGQSFQRFEQGESFYINEHFVPMSFQMRMILSHIENAELMGTSMSPYIDSKILELLCLQFQQPQTEHRESIQSQDIDKIHEASHILISNIHNSPTVRELSIQVGINEKKLQQGFHKVFSTTVYGYLFEYKMNLAVQLLHNTSKTITEIGSECGYEHPSHFCKAFKRKFGFSPLQIRKNSIKFF